MTVPLGRQKAASTHPRFLQISASPLFSTVNGLGSGLRSGLGVRGEGGGIKKIMVFGWFPGILAP
jgi:hypothetical protein